MAFSTRLLSSRVSLWRRCAVNGSQWPSRYAQTWARPDLAASGPARWWRVCATNTASGQSVPAAARPAAAAQDVDVILNGDPLVDEAVLLRVLADTLQGDYTPVATAGGFVDFQLSRGLLGVST
jgi:hypothetical protein